MLLGSPFHIFRIWPGLGVSGTTIGGHVGGVAIVGRQAAVNAPLLLSTGAVAVAGKSASVTLSTIVAGSVGPVAVAGNAASIIAPGTEYTLFDTTTPSGDGGDPSGGTYGVVFTPSFDGHVKGLRFYKETLNTGTHTGALYSIDGTLLGSKDFSGETSTGWQRQDLDTPIAVTAGAYYMAVVFMPAGHYAADSGYFASSSHTNGPLTAIKDTVPYRNGQYSYGGVLGFPTSSFGSANYWVDLVFFY